MAQLLHTFQDTNIMVDSHALSLKRIVGALLKFRCRLKQDLNNLFFKFLITRNKEDIFVI